MSGQNSSQLVEMIACPAHFSADIHDVRVGRGCYPTLSAHLPPLLRWPLNHFLVTPQFRVVSLTRPPGVGSDHFGLLADLALARE